MTPGHRGQYSDCRREGDGRKVEEGERDISGDGRRLDLVNTQYNIQMMCHRIVHLKPI